MAKHAELSLGIIHSICGARNLIFSASATVLLPKPLFQYIHLLLVSRFIKFVVSVYNVIDLA